VLFNEPKGTLLPLGGLEAGHKGYALALLVEALTAGLAGFGRADPAEGWGATVFVQVLDPEAFGGRDTFLRQTSWLADACRAATPRPGGASVRLPGERGVRLMREQRQHGVELHASILPALEPWAEKLAVPMPGTP
jgi:LDH2 family malate/lactate/ureidoglycolate dehydrogenase